MRIVVAPQEFKGTFSAAEATSIIARAVAALGADIEITVLPMADGGPGTLDAIHAAIGGEACTCDASDALLRPVSARWLRLPGGRAVIESAEAAGLWRLQQEELDPGRATTFGVGSVLLVAIAAGCRDLTVGLGGTATNDAGSGLAQALGFRLLDAAGVDLPPGGAALVNLASIEPPREALPRLHVIAATDVTNPLLGPEGATTVFGRQKGADSATVDLLEAALSNFADIALRDLGIRVHDVPRGGAAGGLAAGLQAFLGAELVSGAEGVGAASGLAEKIAAADLVVTGEGRVDGQTASGKTTAYVASLARSLGKPVICLAGSLGEGYERAEPLFDTLAVVSPAGAQADPSAAASALHTAAMRAVSAFLRV